jgi:hypothetical protein
VAGRLPQRADRKSQIFAYQLSEKIMPQLKEVTAYEAYAIFADYDAEAPTTEDLLVVGTEDLAKEIVSLFNKNPRAVNMAFVEGFEHCKSFDQHKVFVETDKGVLWSVKEALEEAEITEEELNEDSDDEDD